MFEEMLVADRNLSLQTVSAYKTDVLKFIDFKDNFLDTSKLDIDKYIEFLKSNGTRPTSLNRNISSLRQFFAFLYDEKIIKKNPMTLVKLRSKNIPLPKILSEDDMLSIISFFETNANIRLKTMLHILYGAGLRVSELVNLTTDSIVKNPDTNKCVLLVRGKGNKERVIPLNDLAVSTIFEYIQQKPFSEKSAYLFPSHKSKTGHITRQGFAKMLKELADNVGIPRCKISPHVIRHAFATHLLSHGADLLSIQKLLGHKDISTTQIYTHVSDDKIKTLVERNTRIKKLKV